MERCATGTVQQQTIYCLSSVKNQTVIHVIVSALQINQTCLDVSDLGTWKQHRNLWHISPLNHQTPTQESPTWLPCGVTSLCDFTYHCTLLWPNQHVIKWSLKHLSVAHSNITEKHKFQIFQMLFHLFSEDLKKCSTNKTLRENTNIATMSAPSYWFQHGCTTAVLAYSDGQLFSTPFIEIKIPCHNSICGVKHRQDVIIMEVVSVYNLLAAALTAPASFLLKSWAFSGKRTLPAIRLQLDNLSPALERENRKDSQTLPQKMTWAIVCLLISYLPGLKRCFKIWDEVSSAQSSGLHCHPVFLGGVTSINIQLSILQYLLGGQ